MRTSASYLIVLFFLVFHIRNANAQTTNNDSLAVHKKYRYWNVTLLAGANVSFHQKTNGLINVSFPYQFSKDGIVGIDSFTCQKQDLRFTTRAYFLPVAFEMGNDKAFFNCGIAFSPMGLNMSGGVGFIAFPNGGKATRDKNFASKRFIVKCSVNAYYETGNFSRKLGTINNAGSTIKMLGLTEDSTFSIVRSSKSGSHTDTYNAQNLNVYYRQNELAILPKISIGNNPFRSGDSISKKTNKHGKPRARPTWELAVGYNIDVYNKAGLSFIQDDGDRHKTTKSKIVGLETDELNVLYNGKKINHTPYTLSGLYLSFAFYVGDIKIK